MTECDQIHFTEVLLKSALRIDIASAKSLFSFLSLLCVYVCVCVCVCVCVQSLQCASSILL